VITPSPRHRLPFERSLIALALLAAGCSEASHVTPKPQSTGRLEAVEAKPAQSATAAPSAPVADVAASAAAAPSPPVTDAAATGEPSSVYLAIDKVGIVRLDSDAFVPAIRTKSTMTAMTLAPDGALWASFYDDGTLRAHNGKVEKLSSKQYRAIAVRSGHDAWAVTEDIEWQLEHYDGSGWKKVKTRADFPGGFSDNKLNDLAITADELWISSWNGLWRLAGSTWQPIAPPAGVAAGQAPYRLLTAGKEVLARFHEGCFAREGAGWRSVQWPKDATLTTMSSAGLAAGNAHDDQRIVLGTPGPRPIVTSEALKATRIDDIAIDESGRAWVATDYALTVVDKAGHVITAWEPGTLAGVDGRVSRVAVLGRGPARLPGARVSPRWEITGRIELYKSSKPLANITVELCPDADAERGCAGAPLKRTATTSPDGSFRLKDVPQGDFEIHAVVPPGVPECGGIFRVRPDRSVSISRDCKVDAGAPAVCAVPTLRTCLPFEMPPPH
jgi:hypothetical protein